MPFDFHSTHVRVVSECEFSLEISERIIGQSEFSLENSKRIIGQSEFSLEISKRIIGQSEFSLEISERISVKANFRSKIRVNLNNRHCENSANFLRTFALDKNSAFFFEKPRNSRISSNYVLITFSQYCTSPPSCDPEYKVWIHQELPACSSCTVVFFSLCLFYTCKAFEASLHYKN